MSIDPVFFDIEASAAFGGFPVEIGWAFVLDGMAIVSESHLIRPEPEWTDARWDDDAEQLHGISPSKLIAHGEWPDAVAQRMNTALASRFLFSDSGFDEHWLNQLFEASRFSQQFTVRRTSPKVLAREFAAKHALPATVLEHAIEHATRVYPPTHRAAQDASHWAAVWKCLMCSRS